MSPKAEPGLLPRELIQLDARVADKAEALRQAAALLEAGGCTRPGFAASMARREGAAETYLGKGIAIPHGMVEDRDLILRDGIAVLQLAQLCGMKYINGQNTVTYFGGFFYCQ